MRVLTIDKSKTIKYLEKIKYKYTLKNDTIDVVIKSSLESLDILNNIKGNISSFEVIEGNIDQVFINLTGKEIKGE